MNPILKRTLTGFILGCSIACAVVTAPFAVVTPVCALLAILALLELGALLKAKRLEEPSRAHAAFLFFAVFILALFCTLPLIVRQHGNVTLLFVLAIVKFSDVGGFAFGHLSASLMRGGNHKLCPTISPGKSWEGLLGSVVFSCAVSCAFIPATKFGVPKALVFGLVAAFVGTFGDLVESPRPRLSAWRRRFSERPATWSSRS